MNFLRRPLVLLVLLALLLAPLRGWAQAETPPPAAADQSPVAPIATAVAAITGIAISPLLGTAVYGAYQYFATPKSEHHDLPWFARMKFWVPALLLVGAVALKDALGATLPPGWKKPLDLVETVENKISGLVAAGAVVPITMDTLAKVLVAAVAPESGLGELPLAGAGLATLPAAALDGASLLSVLTVPFGLAVFAVVWMASHAINVLILLSPWGAIDAALKAARTGVLGLVTLAANVDPWIGAIGSLVVIVISYAVAGWSFRLTVFGTLFCWDFFTGRRRRFRVHPQHNRLFSAGKLKDVPPRTYGRLVRAEDGALRFVYRPWLVLPEREAPLPPTRSLAVGRGLFFSLVETEGGGVLLLPPRYRDHEEELAAACGIPAVRDAGLRRAWSWIRETLGFGPRVTPAAP